MRGEELITADFLLTILGSSSERADIGSVVVSVLTSWVGRADNGARVWYVFGSNDFLLTCRLPPVVILVNSFSVIVYRCCFLSRDDGVSSGFAVVVCDSLNCAG